MPQFVEHLTSVEAQELKKGDKIDFLDTVNNCAYPVEIIATRTDEVKYKNKQDVKYIDYVKIHYIGWSKHWDNWVCYEKEPHRFAKSGTETIKPPNYSSQFKPKDITLDISDKYDDEDQPPPSYEALANGYADVDDQVIKTKTIKQSSINITDFDDVQGRTDNDTSLTEKDSGPTSYLFMCCLITCTNKQRNIYMVYHLSVDIICLILSVLAWSMGTRYNKGNNPNIDRCRPLNNIIDFGEVFFIISCSMLIVFILFVVIVKCCKKCITMDEDSDECCSLKGCIECCIQSCCAYLWSLFTHYGVYILSVVWFVIMIILMVNLAKGMRNWKCSDIQIECGFLFTFMLLIPASRFPCVFVWLCSSPSCKC